MYVNLKDCLKKKEGEVELNLKGNRMINIEKLKVITMHDMDKIGTVCETEDNRILRRIRRENIEKTREMFDCGLIQELIEKDLICKCNIIDESDSEGAMYIEAERIAYTVFPYEWSLGMTLKAALVCLKVNQIALKYGYQLLDPHSWNVMFRGTEPVYIDLGSFAKVKQGEGGWAGKVAFMRHFYYPLKLANSKNGKGCPGLAQRLLGVESEIDIKEYILLFMPVCNRTVFELFWRVKNICVNSILPAFRRRIVHESVAKTCKRCLADTKKMERKIRKVECDCETRWKEYHTKCVNDGEFGEGKRYSVLGNLIKTLKVESIFEIAGNQGYFSQMLLDKGIVKRALSSDYDLGAIDLGIIKNPGRKELFFAVYDIWDIRESGVPFKCDRFKSDIVVALALTHHLILTQHLRIEYFFDKLMQFTNKYILVEFMPLGLWDGKYAPPIPEWYTLDWFKEKMSYNFRILDVVQIEENRIALLGELK